MTVDSLVCAAVLFAACAGGWILARPQRAASRLYVRFAAVLLAALAVCVVLDLGGEAALFLFPLAAAALSVAALARFARRLPDIVASLLLAAGLAIGTVSQRHSQWLARACGLGALATGLIYSFA